MFRSKKRNIVIPQSEHARLAGILAYFWGNENFDKPVIDFDSFVEGVAFHDWAYGINDDLPLGKLSDDKWLEIVEKGAELEFENPIVEIIAKLHIKRLIIGKNFESNAIIINSIDSDVNSKIKLTNYSLEEFLWADRITNLCDMMAFDFSYELNGERNISVCPKRNLDQKEDIRFNILDNGVIKVNPWPFSVSEINGFIISYSADKYPLKLIPGIMKYSIIKSI